MFRRVGRIKTGIQWYVGISLLFSGAAFSDSAPNPVVFDSGMDNQLGLTFTPDGSTAYWVAWNGKWGSNDKSRKQIYVSRQRDGEWSSPVPIAFSGKHSDDDPWVSPDGRWLYFVSDRLSSRDDKSNDANIWRYNLISEGALEYVSINSEAEEYSPVITASGNLYFASSRQGGQGGGDLYKAQRMAEGFATPRALGHAFNTPKGEWNLWVSADENEIIFEASSRTTNVSTPGDLYYSWRTASGWTAATPVGPLNTRNSDLMPRLHPGGETLFYTSAPIGGHAQILKAEWASLRKQLRAEYAPLLMVANRSSHAVSFVDLSGSKIIARLDTGEGPHLLSNVSEDRVLATGYGEFPQPHAAPVSKRPPFVTAPNSRLTLINTIKRTVLWDTTLEDCEKPHASWIVAQRAYVTCETEKSVAVIDLNNGDTIGQFDTLQNGSHVLSFEPESRTLAISNVDSGSVTLINIDSGNTKIVKLTPGSEGAQTIAGRIWVANGTDGSISIVDPRAGTVVEHIESLCGFPIALSQDAEAQVWVACFASSELISIDPDDLIVKRRIKLSDQPLNVIAHPDRPLAYVSLPRQNAIAEIDLNSGSVARRINVGIEPDGLRWVLPSR